MSVNQMHYAAYRNGYAHGIRGDSWRQLTGAFAASQEAWNSGFHEAWLEEQRRGWDKMVKRLCK